MKISRLKAKDYSIIIGKNSISKLPIEIKTHCPKCKKIAIIIDKKIRIEHIFFIILKENYIRFELTFKRT